MSSQMPMRLARCPWLAEQVIVRDAAAVERFVRAGVLRPLDEVDIVRYAHAWRDPPGSARCGCGAFVP